MSTPSPSPRQHVSADQFKRSLADGEKNADAVLVKDFAPEIVKDVDGPDSRTVQFVISTGAVDRDGDTIDPQGWDLKSFQQAGAILWGHDASQLPIAEPLATWVEGGKLKSRCRFPSREVYAFADTVYQLIKSNVLRCTSVGFRPKSWKESGERTDSWGYPSLDFVEQELMEYSVVSVPSNPEALVEAKSMGIDMGPYLQWAEKTLDTMAASGLLVPRNALERTYFATKGATSIVVPGKLESKAGRVLSTKNMERLQAAADSIQEVIDSAGTAESDDEVDDEAAAAKSTDKAAEGQTAPAPVEEPKPSDKPEPLQCAKGAASQGAKDAAAKAETGAKADDDEVLTLQDLQRVFEPKKAVEAPADDAPPSLAALGDMISEMVDSALARARGR